MLQQSLRIDSATLEQFRQLATNGQNCEQLINQALQEWLAAQGLKEMVRAEVQSVLRQTLSATLHSNTPSVSALSV